MTTVSDRIAHIAQLNDELRTTGNGGTTMLTAGVAALPPGNLKAVLAAVRGFTAFTADNDPHQERECAVVQVGDHSILWKIDYYNPDMTGHSPDPADPSLTCRVMTVMFVSEY